MIAAIDVGKLLELVWAAAVAGVLFLGIVVFGISVITAK